MKEFYREDLASRSGLESYAGVGDVAGANSPHIHIRSATDRRQLATGDMQSDNVVLLWHEKAPWKRGNA